MHFVPQWNEMNEEETECVTQQCVTALSVCAALTFNRGKLPALLLSAPSQVGRPAEINIATVSKKPVPPL